MKASLEEATRERALHVLRELRQRLDSKAGKAINEAATRLIVIDEILIALGWRKDEFNPETRSGTGFTDYLLSIDEMPRLVIEAKRVGHTFASTKRLAKTEYTLSYMRSAFGQKLTEVLVQAERYAKEHGVPFAALTNGPEWILVQLIPQPGQTPDDLKCFHFDFGREDGNFDLFWELLSKDGVDSGRLGESFAELNAAEFEYSAVPCRELGPFTWRRPASDDLLLDEFYRLFLDEIVDPARRHMLQQCFVTSARLDQYEGNLKRVLKDTAPEYIDAEKDLSPGEHSSLLPGDSGDQRGRVVLVTGSVGCGKSTFVTKVLVEIRKEKRAESLLVDLIDDAEASVGDVTGLLWKRVLDEWRLRKPECVEYAMLRTIFHGEVEQLKVGAKAKIFERDENAYVQAEAELLDRCAHDAELFLKRAWRHYGKQPHKGVVVFIDNVDRASEDFQRRTYAFAHALAAATGATVIVPMREMTFFRGKSAGFLDVRSSDIVYHLQAPDPVQVLAKRIKYVESELESDHRYRQLKQGDHGDALLAACRQHARTLKDQLLDRPSGRQIIGFASSVAWHDIRSFLVCVHEVHAALGEAEWVAEKAVAALLVARDAGGRARIPNLYAPPYPAYASMFVKARTLALLLYSTVPERVKQGLPLSSIIRVLRVYGYRDRWSRRAVEELVRDRLLECLEAPAAAEYTKTYELEEAHSFRPSPMAVVLVESIQFQAAYLGIIGADLTFHSPRVHAEYVACVTSLLDVMDDRQLDHVGIALLLESEAPKLVGRYLRQMFEKERPLPDLARYFPEISAIERRLKETIAKLPGDVERPGGTTSAPPSQSANAQLGLDFVATTADTSSGDERPSVPLPELLPAARIGLSTLGPAILWALAELQERGETPTTGARIAEVINAHVYSDQDRKEPTNVSRALRHPLLRAEAWLAVYGEERTWRYGLSSTWRKDWRRIFHEPPPTRGDKDR